MTLLHCLIVVIYGQLCLALERDPNTGWFPFPGKNVMVYTTTQFVTDWDLVQDVVPSLDPELWMENLLALGFNGPLGPFGPLGSLGPLGTNAWNPSYWISGAYAWDEWSDLMLDGPLSEEGPLGESGPYTPQEYYHGDIFEENAFAPHTRAMGVWGVLGPIGPLGAVGALGVLSPIGATGYQRNNHGEYLDERGEVHTTIDVPYNSTMKRSFDLYEQFSPDFARALSHNNASFLVEDNCCADSAYCLEPKIHTYPITSDVDQIITVVVVPLVLEEDTLLNVMYLNLLNGHGKPIDGTNTYVQNTEFINFIQFTAHVGDKFNVQVIASPGAMRGNYRLYVTGSYAYLNQYNFTGKYIRVVNYTD